MGIKKNRENQNEGTKNAQKSKIVQKYRNLKGPASVVAYVFIAIVVFLSLNWMFDWRLFVGYVMQPYTFYYLIVALITPLVYLYVPATKKQRISEKKGFPFYLDLIIAFGIFVSNLYLAYNAYNIYMYGWERVAPLIATIISVFLWGCYIEAARRCAGKIITIIILLVAALPLYTQFMPGLFNGLHKPFLQTAQMHILGTDSSMGMLMRTFAEIVLPYTIFGTVIIICGGGEFFLNVALRLFGKFRGGTAKVAVVSSSLFGTISGNPVVNVLTTGSVTIPAMKKAGFEPRVAGAVEACASTAGTMTPPIMGTASFVMASILGISYAEVAVSAIIPIFFFYICFMMSIDMYAAKKGLCGIARKELPSLRKALKTGWFFIPTMLVLIFFIFVKRQIPEAAIFASVTAIVCVQFNKATRFKKKNIATLLKNIGTNCLEVIGVMLGIGFILGSFSMTGIGISFPREVFLLAGGNTAVLIVLTAITSLIMGMGMTTIACYIFLSIVIAPALVMAGLDIMCVHLFLLYCGMLSYITPPVAVATIPAAMLSGAKGTKVATMACRLGMSLIFIPFFFITNPDLLLRGDNIWETGLSIFTLLFALLVITQAIEGYFYGIGQVVIKKTPRVLSIIALLAGALLLALKGIYTDIIGLGIIAAILIPIYIVNLRKKRKGVLLNSN